MNFICSEDENVTISENYYSLVKYLYENYIKLISNYKIATNEYIKKITIINEKYSPRLMSLKEEFKKIPSLDTSHIITLSSILPKIIDQQITNGQYLVQGIDKQLESFDKFIHDKTNEFNKIFDSFKESKNELIKKYKEIEKIKINYMSLMSTTEDTIYKYYLKQNKDKNRLLSKNSNNNINTNLNETNKNNLSKSCPPFPVQNSFGTLDNVKNCISKTKKIEFEYKYNLNLVKKIENKFIEISINTIENTRKLLCEISTSMKESICDCMVFMKNYFKIPLSEVNTYINEIIDLDEKTNFNNIILKSYKNNNLFLPMKPEKYLFKINNNPQELQEMDFIEEEDILLTIKKLCENFEFIEKNNLDFDIEENKLRCKYLTLKILSFAPQNKIYKFKIQPISEIEIEEINNMLDKDYIRIIFLQRLSEFRTRGIFDIPDREFSFLGKLFNTIINKSEESKDYNSIKNAIILSQTYFHTNENNNKYYLLNFIIKNELFKSKNFWEEYVDFNIKNDLLNSEKEDKKNGVVNKEGDKVTEEKISNVVFAQLVPITNNMIEFGVDVEIIENIILPKISKYKIRPELAEVVYSVIKINKNDVGK